MHLFFVLDIFRAFPIRLIEEQCGPRSPPSPIKVDSMGASGIGSSILKLACFLY